MFVEAFEKLLEVRSRSDLLGARVLGVLMVLK